MNAFLALVRNDLRMFFMNRRAVIMSIAAPILIAAFFGALFGGGDAKPANIPVAVADLDRSALSTQLIAALKADTALTVRETSEAEGQTQVRAGKVRALITLPAGFGAQAGGALMGGGTKPEVPLEYDPSQTMVLPLVRGLLSQHVMQLVAKTTFGGAAPAISLPFTVRETEAQSSKIGARYNSYSHSFAGMSVQFVLLMGVDMGVALLLMRRLGMWKRLRAAPLSRSKLIGSRVASFALIALIVFGVVYAVAMAVFGVRIEGSVAGFVLLLVAFALLTASFGLMIATLGRTPEATRGLATLASLLLVMLGGAWVPAFIFPQWLQDISLAVPVRWAVDGLDAVTWRGQPFEAAVMPVVVMLGFTAAFTLIAMWRFEWEE